MNIREQLKKQWKNRGLDSKQFTSATIAPPPPLGFKRGYHLIPTKYGVSNIKLSRLKVARFSDVNDPFELLALNFHERSIRQLARKHKKDQDLNTGLLCFSTDWKSPLLWSHYAEKHRGLCLGFDLKEITVEAVKYEDKRLRTVLAASGGNPVGIPPDLQKLLLVTKARCWEYEEEFRLFIALSKARLDGKFYFWPFSADLRLVEVIIGPECKESVSAIERIAGPNVYASKARLAWRTFTIVPAGDHLSSKLRP
jgi:hypothetical protein